MSSLSKSKYIVGVECLRFLWFCLNDPKKTEPSENQLFVMSEGTEVGELATKLFPDGVLIEGFYNKKHVDDTLKALELRKPVFEGYFKFGECSAKPDILDPVGVDEWDLYEVKSGTRVKDINLHDVSFQKYVYEGCGLKIRKCFLIILNKDYVKNGDINLNELFRKEDITDSVEALMGDIEFNIKRVLKVMDSKEIPVAGIFDKLSVSHNQHDCLEEKLCVDEPVNSVFNLVRGGRSKGLALFNQDVKFLKDVPKSFKLSGKQKIQVECDHNNKEYFDKENIKLFFDGLVYPLYCMDFESFSTPVPLFDGLKPHSQIPFQFSIHKISNLDDTPEHFEFLHEENTDPREEFVKALKEMLGDKGSIVVYYKSYEEGRLNELAELFPEYKEWVEKVKERIVDLYEVFSKFYYYNTPQAGSTSIKKVLPTLTGKGYENLEIQDGQTAGRQYYETYHKGKNNKNQIKKELLEYCRQDTMSEIQIIKQLRKKLN